MHGERKAEVALLELAGFLGANVAYEEKVNKYTVKVIVDQDMLDEENVAQSYVTQLISETVAKATENEEAEIGLHVTPARVDTPLTVLKRLTESSVGIIGCAVFPMQEGGVEKINMQVAYDSAQLSPEALKTIVTSTISIMQKKTGCMIPVKVGVAKYNLSPIMTL